MSVLLTVGTETFDFPTSGQDPGWGEPATDWAIAVTAVLATLVGPGDIINTTSAILDNQSTPTTLQGLAFDGAQTRSANVVYNIVRGSTTQAGTLLVDFNTNASIGSKWSITESGTLNDVGVSFSITDAGQVQYVSSATGTAGQITFTAKTLPTV